MNRRKSMYCVECAGSIHSLDRGRMLWDETSARIVAKRLARLASIRSNQQQTAIVWKEVPSGWQRVSQHSALNGRLV